MIVVGTHSYNRCCIHALLPSVITNVLTVITPIRCGYCVLSVITSAFATFANFRTLRYNQLELVQNFSRTPENAHPVLSLAGTR